MHACEVVLLILAVIRIRAIAICCLVRAPLFGLGISSLVGMESRFRVDSVGILRRVGSMREFAGLSAVGGSALGGGRVGLEYITSARR